MKLRELLDGVASGTIPREEAEKFLDSYGLVEIGYHRLDVHRQQRTSLPEAIFGRSKSVEQLREIIGFYDETRRSLIATKIDEERAALLCGEFARLAYHRDARLLTLGASETPVAGSVSVVSAGSSDLPIAEEAAATLRFFDIDVARVYDVGVAGLHRLFNAGETIAECDLLIAVAGMEGALPSVLAGLFRQPVIAVPTSVGYGASFEGLAALLTMLNSCAPGVTVVNIDNGFGAAMAAKSILAMHLRKNTAGER